MRKVVISIFLILTIFTPALAQTTISDVNTTSPFFFGDGSGLTGLTESQIVDLTHTVDTDTNESTRVGNAASFACSGTDKISSFTAAMLPVCTSDTDTTYTNSTGISLVGTTFSHFDTSSQADSDNSARTYIQDIFVDSFGHITSIETAAETFVDTLRGTSSSDPYLYNDSTTIFFNETHLNQTIDDKIPAGISDTNETTRFNNLVNADCSGTDKVIGVLDNGTVLCGADVDTSLTDIFVNESGDTMTGTLTMSGTNQVQSGTGVTGTPGFTFITDTSTGMYRAGAGGIGFSNAGSASVIISSSRFIELILGGSAATPAITRNSDTDTGIFWPDLNEIGMAVGGSQILGLDSTGANITGTLNANALTANDWSDVSITESQISDLTHTVDTDTNTQKGTSDSDPYLTNDSTNILFNETFLNLTIDDKVSAISVSDIWVNESGDTMTGNLNMSTNNIREVGRLLVEDGSLASPSISWENSPSSGLNSNFADQIDIVTGGSLAARFFNQQSRFDQGTSTSPGIAFAQDLNTGLYRPSSDILGLIAGGQSKLNITTSEIFAFGNLTVNGNVSADYFVGDGSLLTGISTSVTDIWVNESGDTMTGPLYVISRVGVNNNQPNATLHVTNSTGDATFMLEFTGGGGGGGGTLTLKDLSSTGQVIDASDSLSINGDSGISLKNSGNTMVQIDSSGTQIVGSNATSGLPAYRFSGDTNSGLFHPTDDVIGVSAGAVHVANFSSSGFVASNLGAGLVTPTSSLDIQLTGSSDYAKIRTDIAGSIDGELRFLDPVGNTESSICLSQQVGGGCLSTSEADDFIIRQVSTNPLIFATGNAEKMRITGTGDVGIGTNSPNAKLEVVGDINVTTDAQIGGDLGVGTFVTTPSSDLHVTGGVCIESSDSGCTAAAGELIVREGPIEIGTNAISEAGSNTAVAMDGTLDFIGGGTHTIRFRDPTPASDQGITYNDTGGTARQAFILDPTNSLVSIRNRASNGVVDIRANTVTAGSGGERTVATFQDDNITFSPNDVDVAEFLENEVRFFPGGNSGINVETGQLGINITNPSAALHVRSDPSNNVVAIFRAKSGTQLQEFRFQNGSGSNMGRICTIDSSSQCASGTLAGDLYIGSELNDERLSFGTRDSGGTNAVRMFIQGNGDIRMDGDTFFLDASTNQVVIGSTTATSTHALTIDDDNTIASSGTTLKFNGTSEQSYIQLPVNQTQSATPGIKPPASECNTDSEIGKMTVKREPGPSETSALWICMYDTGTLEWNTVTFT